MSLRWMPWHKHHDTAGKFTFAKTEGVNPQGLDSTKIMRGVSCPVSSFKCC